ncbi:MAG: flagellar basal body P-ring formation chaperone FlgA [Myxococcota bacterium]
MSALLLLLALGSPEFFSTPRAAILDVLPDARRETLPVYVRGLPRPGARVRYWARIDPSAGRSDTVEVELGALAAGRSWPSVRLRLPRRHTTLASIATRDLPPGHLLSDGDLALAEVELRGGGPTVPSIEELLGTRLVRGVRAGEPIRRRAAAAEPIVRRGNTVDALWRVGGLQVVVTARALQDGRQGETIRVLNEMSKTSLRGVVVDAHRVEIRR